MNSFKEWLSDNLRYILLGFVCIVLLLVGFFVVRLITGTEKSVSDKSTKNETSVEQSVKDDSAEKSAENAGPSVVTSSQLVRDEEGVLNIVSKYYAARASKDFDTLKELCEVFDDNTRAEIESQDAAIESYNNIITYSKAGMTPDSYVVYTYFDAKLSGVATLAPSLRELYLVKNSNGDLVISDKDSDAKLAAFIERLRTDDDVQALIADVDQKLEEAEASDTSLRDFLESGASAPQPEDSEDGSAEEGSDGGSLGTKMANTGVNVRGEPSADGALYGSLYEGMEVEVLENLDNGWSHIRYTSNGTTIEGYVMTQYLS